MVLGWGNYSSSPYENAAAAVPKIGEIFGKFIFFYVRWCYINLINFHMIGHSFGAHLFAFSAQFLNSRSTNKVKELTGNEIFK